MRRLSTVLLVLVPLALVACSTLSVESEVLDSQALTRTLVVVMLSGKPRRVAEETLVARLAWLNPATSYETVPLRGTLGSLRERARNDGFDGLLVVRLEGSTVKEFPGLAGEGDMGIPSSSQIRTRTVATLTGLNGDVEIWKGVVTNRDAQFPISPRLARSEVALLADRLQRDRIAD